LIKVMWEKINESNYVFTTFSIFIPIDTAIF